MDFLIAVMMAVSFCVFWIFSNREREESLKREQDKFLKREESLKAETAKLQSELNMAFKYAHLLPPWNDG